jgi:N-ethylmaleimide reductase
MTVPCRSDPPRPRKLRVPLASPPMTELLHPKTSLATPLQVGDIRLANRLVMAPLTRNRAGPGNVPTPLMALYYAQRSDPLDGAGLIVSEATHISVQGRGYVSAPGLHTAEQIAGWQGVTQAVHAAGGRIVAQLWHVGRTSHVDLQDGGAAPVSSTARVAAGRRAFTPSGLQACSPPRALADDELPGIVAGYAQAARNALEAGFDGVEVHGANGYLIEQFLRDTVNDRPDGPYAGSSIAGRIRLLVDVVRAVEAAVGAGRTGLRLSPNSPLADAAPDSQAQALHEAALQALADLPLAYVHVIEGQTGGSRDPGLAFDFAALRRCTHPETAWMVNNGYTGSLAAEALAEGRADLVAFGKPFIANPDLGRRLREGLPLAAAESKHFYGPGTSGLADWPRWGEAAMT